MPETRMVDVERMTTITGRDAALAAVITVLLLLSLGNDNVGGDCNWPFYGLLGGRVLRKGGVLLGISGRSAADLVT